MNETTETKQKLEKVEEIYSSVDAYAKKNRDNAVRRLKEMGYQVYNKHMLSIQGYDLYIVEAWRPVPTEVN